MKQYVSMIKLIKYRVVYVIINDEIVLISTVLAGIRVDVHKKMDGLK